MIKVLIPNNHEFLKYENDAKLLYKQIQHKICDTNSFDFIKDNTFFYLFTTNNKFLGCIYYFLDNNKLYVNAFANRKYLKEKLYCLKLSTLWFNCDIYAEAQNRASAFCLLKCGFKRVHNNIFVLKNKAYAGKGII